MDRKIYLPKQIVRKLREAEVIICLLEIFMSSVNIECGLNHLCLEKRRFNNS